MSYFDFEEFLLSSNNQPENSIDPNGLKYEVFMDAVLTAPDLPIESSSVLEYIAQMSFTRIEDVHDILNFLSNIPYDPSAGDVKQHKTLEEAQAYAFANIALRILSEYQANNDASKYYLDGYVEAQTVNADGDVINYYEFVRDIEENNDYVNSFYNQQSNGGDIDYPSRANYLYSLSGVGINASAPLLLGEWSTRNAYGVSWYNMSRAEQVSVHSSSSRLGYKAFGNTARFIGRSSVFIGVGIDAYGLVTNKPGSFWGKLGVNTGVGLWGLTGVGTIPALVYFGAEAYYPGGFIQLFNDSGRWHDDTKRILGPGWRPVPFGPK